MENALFKGEEIHDRKQNRNDRRIQPNDQSLYLTITKNLLKTLRRQGCLNATFTPKNVPKELIQTTKPFFADAKEIADLRQKAAM